MRENTIVKQTSLNMKYNAKKNVWCTSIEKKNQTIKKKVNQKLKKFESLIKDLIKI